ncbi:hypothetical protein DFJ74DRAFT_667997 [Hyaloraphidium curvatum]|nr:hypothetical protein DFJ74DRAFT_667997 [Hyaloraphidium curvatum]
MAFNATAASPALLDPPLHALASAAETLLPAAVLALAVNGSALYAAHETPFKFAHFQGPILRKLGVPQEYVDKIWDFPPWFREAWTANIEWAVRTIASFLLPSVFGEATRMWLAEGLFYSYVMKVVFIVVFFPQFLFYRGADHYGYLDRWKTNPYRENPDKETEAKYWNGLWPSVLYSFPTETFILWAINFGRGEMALSVLPSFADVMCKLLFDLWLADTMYFWMHWWEHQPGIYQKVHKAHHQIRWLNVYGFFYQNNIERYMLRFNSFVGNMIIAHTFGHDLMTAILSSAFFISSDIHIHTGYTVPWIPMNWINPQYFHDFHHSQNRGNYSAFFNIPPFSWDWWMGTDKNWRRFRKAGGEVRLHRNTWPGFYVEGDLDIAKKQAAEQAKEDDAAVVDGKGKDD